jgi:hypothetical protein
MINLGKLTWKCHVCGEERPDRFISVAKYTTDPLGRVPSAKYNVRYCNDRGSCSAGTYAVAERWAKPFGGLS